MKKMMMMCAVALARVRTSCVAMFAAFALAVNCQGVDITKLETVQRENGLVDIVYTLANSEYDPETMSPSMGAKLHLVRTDGVEIECQTIKGTWGYENGTHTVTWDSSADNQKGVAGNLALRLWSLRSGSASYSADQPPAWSIDSAVKYGSSSSVRRSNAIGSSSATDFWGSFWGPGTMTFAWKVSSEPTYDTLSYYVDGVCKKTISGITNWETIRISVTDDREHRIRFRYSKDGSVSKNEDCGWFVSLGVSTGFLKAERSTYYLRSVTVTDETKTLADITGGNANMVTNVVVADGIKRLATNFGVGATNVRSVKIEHYDDLVSGCCLKDWFPSAYSKIETLAFGYGNYTIYGVPKKIPSSFIDGCTALRTVGAPISQPIGEMTWVYTLADGGATVGSGSYDLPAVPATTTGNIVIPTTLWGRPVVGLSGYAFYKCIGITSVTIPDTVRQIGDWAFRGCGLLTHVDMPQSLEILNRYVFYGCDKLQSIDIPNAVTNIAYSVFYNCSNLVSVTIGENVRTIGKEAFQNCVSLSEVSFSPTGPCTVDKTAFDGCTALIPAGAPYRIAGPILMGYNGTCSGAVVIPNGIQIIATKAFENCWDISSVTFPKGLLDINDEAFYCCNGIAELDFPDSLRNVGDSAFCRRDYVYIGGKELRTPPDQLRTVHFGTGKLDLGEFAFAYRTNLLSVASEGMIGSMGRNAFYENDVLESVSVKNGIGGIGKYAFLGCFKLFEFSAFEGTTEIGEHAFQACALTKVTLPKTLREVKQGAFCYCSKLTEVVFLGDDAIVGSTESSQSAQDWWFGIFQNCENLKTVRLPANMKYIPSWCFDTCPSLQSISIPAGVTTIAEMAFSGCRGLTEIKIPDGVTDIARYGFSRCDGLTEIDLPSCLVTIGDSAFSSCTGLVSVVIPDSVQTLGEYAIASCYALQRVDVGKGVVSMGDYVFQSSRSLGKIVFRGNAPKVNQLIYGSPPSGSEVLVSKGSMGWGVSIPGTWKGFPIRYIYHTVAFDVNGGEGSFPAIQCDDGSKIGTLPVPTRKGYDFAGWYTPEGGRVTSDYVPTKDVTLKAQWTIRHYSITYVNDRGKSAENPSTYTIVDAVAFKALPDDGDSHFITWNPSRIETGSYGDVAITACWARVTAAYSPVSPWQEGSEMVHVDYEIESDIDISALYPQVRYCNGGGTNTASNVWWHDAVWDEQTYMMDYSGALSNGTHEATYYIGYEYGINFDNPISLGMRISGGIGQEYVQSSWSCSGPYSGEYAVDLSCSGEVSFRWNWNRDSWGARATFYIDGEAIASCRGLDGTTELQTYRLGPGRHKVKWYYDWSHDDSGYVNVTDIRWKPDMSVSVDIRTELTPFDVPMTEYTITYENVGGVENPNPATFTKKDQIEFVPLADHDNMQFVRWEPAGIVKGTTGDQRVRAVWKELHIEDLIRGEGVSDVKTGGDADWKVVHLQDAFALRSGAITNSQETIVQATVSGPGVITFRWKASTEMVKKTPIDYCEFTIDGLSAGRIGGITDWQGFSATVSGSGKHVIAWRYCKDEDDFQGEDCVWLDSVLWTPQGQPIEPGGEIVVPEGKTAKEFADEVNKNKAQYLKWPLEGSVSTDYLSYFTAVPKGDAKVEFVLNEEGTNQVVEAMTAAKTNTLESVLSKTGTLVIGDPLIGFYYSLKQGSDVTVGDKADLNKLAGRDTLEFPLTTDKSKYFYQSLVTPTPLPKE